MSDNLTPTRNIKIVSKENAEVLFEGLSSDTRLRLVEQFGENIDVYYEQQYVTVLEDQSYADALIDINSKTKKCFTREEFEQFLVDEAVTSGYKYIAYSQKNLNSQKPKAKKTSNITSSNANAFNCALFFYTSFSQVEGGFPINGLTPKQIEFATDVLKTEDHYVKELGEEQVEGILIIVGTPAFNDAYIHSSCSNLRFITQTEDGQPTKGLIKNSVNADGIQIYVLRLCIKQVKGANGELFLVEKRNTDVLKHVGYIK